MRLRVFISQKIVDLRYKYKFLEKLLFLTVLIMRPDDLVEFGRQSYGRPAHLKIWADERRIDEGLEKEEKIILEKLPVKKGRILVLASGGGREAIFLSRIGYDVTVVDYVPEMVDRAVENAKKKGAKISGLVQDMSRLDMPEESFDVVWLFRGMYSSIPTRRRRLDMLRRIRMALKPGGVFVCQFLWSEKGRDSFVIYFLKKLLVFLIMGNFLYETGDVLWCNTEYMHFFWAEKEIKQEFERAGFQVDYIHFSAKGMKAEALLKKINS